MKKNIIFGVLVLGVIYAGSTFIGYVSAQKRVSDRRQVPDTAFSKMESGPLNSTPQTLPFSQNWTTTTLITANDDWTGVPGIVGFLGDYAPATAITAVDPRSVLVDMATQDVIANQANASSISGGVGEFEIANPTIGLQGSGTADAPNIVINLNTTGQSNIRVSYNARDIDDTADNAIQQIATQYRVGNTGNFITVPGGYIADATTGPSLATLVTPVAVTLPAAASNQPLVQVRILTTNAAGSDEWIGIDDINVTTVATAARSTAPVDFNGDGRTDYSVYRITSAQGGRQLRWFALYTGTNNSGFEIDWGLDTDKITPGDFDGDGKDDITVWRGASGVNSAFYIIQSQTGTFRYVQFGLESDDPFVIGDYDGDGKDDPAIYRPGATANAQSYFWWQASAGVNAGRNVPVAWGAGPEDGTADFPVPGDYTGDGKADFCIYRNNGAGNAVFWIHPNNGAPDSPGGDLPLVYFGLYNDLFVPGDYDGDGKTDIAATRNEGGKLIWYILPSSGAPATGTHWGIGVIDYPVQGDYDGDGRTDIAVWRPNIPPSFPDPSAFYVLGSSSGFLFQQYGLSDDTDQPTALDTH